jgi:hypothetical protein
MKLSSKNNLNLKRINNFRKEEGNKQNGLEKLELKCRKYILDFTRSISETSFGFASYC